MVDFNVLLYLFLLILTYCIQMVNAVLLVLSLFLIEWKLIK